LAKKTVRGKDAVNKSALIREYAQQHGTTSPTEIAKGVTAEHNIEVSASLVSQVMARLSGGAKKSKKNVGAPARGGDMSAIINAAEFVRKAGGVERAKRLIQDVEKLKNALQ
jgi:hypothetical protein